MTDTQPSPMSEESITDMLQKTGARVKGRAGRSVHYGSPRDFSFEVKALFPNNLGLQITARQYTYRDPWETSGRVNDRVDVALLFKGCYSQLPKGYSYFQDTDTEENLDSDQLKEVIEAIIAINPKLFVLQNLTGDL